MKNLTQTNGRFELGAAKSATELVAALTPDDYQQLVGFSRYRLRAVQRSRALQRTLALVEPEDLVAEALLKLQLGDEDRSLGRHLKPEHRTDVRLFLACVKGTIESDLNHLISAARNRYEHVSVGDAELEPGMVEPADGEDPSTLLSRRDLHRVLFAKLHERITRQPALLDLVRDWERRFLEDEQVGAEGQRRDHAWRVRQLAREILAELSELGLDGRELLL